MFSKIIFSKGELCALLVALSTLVAHRAIAEPPRGSDANVKLFILEVWASKKKQPGKCPAELKRFEKLLKARSKSGKETFNSFRLDKAKSTPELTPGKEKTFRLPEDYTLKLTLQRGKGKKRWELKYDLANRDRSWSSKLTIHVRAKKPSVIRSPITRKSEHLVLILACDPPS